MNALRDFVTGRALRLDRLRGGTDDQFLCRGDHLSHLEAWQGKGNGIQEKAPDETCVLSTFLYEPKGQRLSTLSAGEPLYQVLECDTFVRKEPECSGMDG